MVINIEGLELLFTGRGFYRFNKARVIISASLPPTIKKFTTNSIFYVAFRFIDFQEIPGTAKVVEAG